MLIFMYDVIMSVDVINVKNFHEILRYLLQILAKPLNKVSVVLLPPNQKQPSIGVLIKRCSENVQEVYKKTPMLKCDFNKVALRLRH